MNTHQPGQQTKKLSAVFAAIILASFFLPWVNWGAVSVTGKDMATLRFYELSETNFGLTSPFPEMDFANAIFWLIPVLAFASILLALVKKKHATLAGAMAGALVLGLSVVYALFTNELTMFDPSLRLAGALMPAFYAAVVGALGLILCSWHKRLVWKLFFIIAPIVLSYVAFSQIKEGQLTEKVAATQTLKATYSIEALPLIQEFLMGDSAANAKYREQIIEVTGTISELNAKDSTATLSMADSTGSYVIFDFEKDQAPKVQSFKVGDKVVVKGLCSGSIFSDIMGTQTISFKRSILNN